MGEMMRKICTGCILAVTILIVACDYVRPCFCRRENNPVTSTQWGTLPLQKWRVAGQVCEEQVAIRWQQSKPALCLPHRGSLSVAISLTSMPFLDRLLGRSWGFMASILACFFGPGTSFSPCFSLNEETKLETFLIGYTNSMLNSLLFPGDLLHVSKGEGFCQVDL